LFSIAQNAVLLYAVHSFPMDISEDFCNDFVDS